MRVPDWLRRAGFTSALGLFVLGLVGSLASAGTVSHSHASATPAFFNEDHDLGSLATLGSATGLLSQSPSVVPLVMAAPLAMPPDAGALADHDHRSADSRAPPAR